MISCTEFVAAYSELFTCLDDHYGRAEGWGLILPCCLTNGNQGYFPM